jgi:DNA-binding NtrC family response regulator
VLVEDPDGAVRAACATFLEHEGFEVAVCAGPEPGHRCPEVTSGTCSLMEGVDVVYTSLAWRDPAHQEVLRAHREHYPHVPVVVEICRPDVARVDGLLDGCDVVHVPAGRATMLQAIESALDDSTS